MDLNQKKFNGFKNKPFINNFILVILKIHMTNWLRRI